MPNEKYVHVLVDIQQHVPIVRAAKAVWATEPHPSIFAGVEGLHVCAPERTIRAWAAVLGAVAPGRWVRDLEDALEAALRGA